MILGTETTESKAIDGYVCVMLTEGEEGGREGRRDEGKDGGVEEGIEGRKEREKEGRRDRGMEG